MNPVLLLEQYHVTKLHVDWSFPAGEKQVVVQEARCGFDYDIGVHKENPNQRIMRFKVNVQEVDLNGQPVAHHIVCEMLGLFSLTEATPKGKEELILRINGVSLLYGALRGVISTMTGIFPGRGFNLPNIMAQDVVREIEARKAVAARQQELVTTT